MDKPQDGVAGAPPYRRGIPPPAAFGGATSAVIGDRRPSTASMPVSGCSPQSTPLSSLSHKCTAIPPPRGEAGSEEGMDNSTPPLRRRACPASHRRRD